MKDTLINCEKEDLIRIIKEKESEILALKKELTVLKTEYENEFDTYDTGLIWQ